MRQAANRPSKLWPVTTPVTMVDAWGQNEVSGKVIRHFQNEFDILVEDTRGIIHFGETWRLTSEPPKQIAATMFDELLGDTEPIGPTNFDDQFEDLLG